MNMVFADRLSQLRFEKQISQIELANQLNISRQSIGFYERGERLPDIETLYAMCKYFKVTSDYLIGLSNNRTIKRASIGGIIGLSDESIEALKTHKGNYDNHKSNVFEIIDFLISHSLMPDCSRITVEKGTKCFVEILELISLYFNTKDTCNKYTLTNYGNLYVSGDDTVFLDGESSIKEFSIENIYDHEFNKDVVFALRHAKDVYTEEKKDRS